MKEREARQRLTENINSDREGAEAHRIPVRSDRDLAAMQLSEYRASVRTPGRLSTCLDTQGPRPSKGSSELMLLRSQVP